MTVRRHLMAAVAAGAAVVAMLAGGAVGTAQETTSTAEDAGTVVGMAEAGRVSFAFVGQINQNGPLAVDVGYLTSVAGLEEPQLFTGNDPLNRDAASARFTYFASARLESRSVNGNLFVTAGTAETTLFLQPDGGASFDDPTTFRDGTEIATFESRWHDIINVQAPDEGIARVESDDTQRSAEPFELDGEPLVFGSPDARLRLSFTGQGMRSQPEPPVATIRYAGEATALGAPSEPSEPPGQEAGQDGATAPPADAAPDDGTGTSAWVWVALGAALIALVASVAALTLAVRGRPPG